MAKEGIGAILDLTAGKPRARVKRVITLPDAAIGELDGDRSAKCTLLEAASLLREQIDPDPTMAAADDRGRLLAWQARKVVEYIDAHIARLVRVPALCALIARSAWHFSRSFRRSFVALPYAFVIRRRLALAAQYMLETDTCHSDIALRCGFVDQAPPCKHFRRSTLRRGLHPPIIPGIVRFRFNAAATRLVS